MNEMSFSRREAIGALSCGSAALALSACSSGLPFPQLEPTPLRGLPPPDPQAEADVLLQRFGQSLLRFGPEGATSLALDMMPMPTSA